MPRGTYNAPYDGDLRRDLLDAAIRAVAQDGVAQLSLRAVARQVGVSHAAPKNHFPDKAALLTAISVEGFERLGQAMQAASQGASSAIDAMARGGKAYIQFSITNPGYFRVMWRNELHDPADIALQRSGHAVFDALTASVMAAQAEGWGKGHDPKNLALVAWSSVHGVAQLYLDGPLGEMDPRSPELIAQGLVEVIVGRLQTP